MNNDERIQKRDLKIQLPAKTFFNRNDIMLLQEKYSQYTCKYYERRAFSPNLKI